MIVYPRNIMLQYCHDYAWHSFHFLSGKANSPHICHGCVDQMRTRRSACIVLVLIIIETARPDSKYVPVSSLSDMDLNVLSFLFIKEIFCQVTILTSSCWYSNLGLNFCLCIKKAHRIK
jgi:hypothetical protein